MPDLPSPDAAAGPVDEGGAFEADADRTNHDLGFANKWARPDEGDAERNDTAGEDGGFGARGSGGGASALGSAAPLRRFMANLDVVEGTNKVEVV